MNFKSHLITNYEIIFKVKEMLKTFDNNYFTTTIINETVIDTNTISIVMTSCNRSIQTYFTLDTIAKSHNKNIQIILVDDSTTDCISITQLQKYNIHIELINIKNKFWINPCVNYNIGFKHIKGTKVIIQNAEVCHMDDILKYVSNNVNNEEYHSFNVYALNNIEQNALLHNTTYSKITDLKGMWYQHPQHRNAHYHFLVAMTVNTFNKIGGFDIDYSVGVDYDDNALVHRVKNSNIKLINVETTLMGVHQWHSQSSCGSQSGKISNEHLWHVKCSYYDNYKIFLDLTNFPKDNVINIINNLL